MLEPSSQEFLYRGNGTFTLRSQRGEKLRVRRWCSYFRPYCQSCRQTAQKCLESAGVPGATSSRVVDLRQGDSGDQNAAVQLHREGLGFSVSSKVHIRSPTCLDNQNSQIQGFYYHICSPWSLAQSKSES